MWEPVPLQLLPSSKPWAAPTRGTWRASGFGSVSGLRILTRSVLASKLVPLLDHSIDYDDDDDTMTNKQA